MKSYILLFIGVICLAGCSGNSKDGNNAEQEPRTAVTLTHAAYGSIRQEITLSATTIYLNKSVVAAPIPAFITETLVQPGTRIEAGQLLYKLESKERHALDDDGTNGIIPIKAAHNGIVLDVQQQAGSYVTEGTTLCTIADASSLVFSISMPYEQRQYVRTGSHCILELPDGTRLSATIQSPLATMDIASQSEQIIARAKTSFLPEGLNVKALFTTNSTSASKDMVLPKSAVQSDETLTEHWIMKLSADSTAVKVPVEVVRSNAAEVEIKSGAVSLQDNIILTGGYGLEEGARVTTNK